MYKILSIAAIILLTSSTFTGNSYALTFVDVTGYIPNWAKNIQQNQALGVCNTSVEFGTKDSAWCLEFAGFVLDNISGSKAVSFTDHTGYAPDWAKKMGQNQALGVCNSQVEYGTKAQSWCLEFAGYVLDTISGKTTKNQDIKIKDPQPKQTTVKQTKTNDVKSKITKSSESKKQDSKSKITPTKQPQKPKEGFSSTYCTQDEYGFVVMTGKYTNGATAYDTIYITLGVIDKNGNVVATGLDDISEIGPFQTKIFKVDAKYSGSFAKCEVEVKSRYR